MSNELISLNESEIKTSFLIPEEFKKSPKDVIIAVDFARKQGKTIGTTLVAFDYALKFKQSPLTILQAMYEIEGKIGWSADFLFSLLKTKYKKIDFVWKEDLKDNPAVKMVAINEDGETLETEFCYYKSWAKNTDNWSRIPRTMLKRRAITLFSRTNNPEMFSNCFDIDEAIENTKNVTSAETIKPAVKIVTINNNDDKGYF